MGKQLGLLLSVVTLLILSISACSVTDIGWSAYHRGNAVAAQKIWQPLAEQGNPDAQEALGVLYGSGREHLSDYEKAVFWCGKAAAQGKPHSQYILGSLYRRGRGVPQDLVRAYMWYTVSGDQKHLLARVDRKRLVHEMTPGQIAEAERLARVFKSINSND